jgi:hypothetical protein
MIQQQQQLCPQAGESARVSRDVLEIRLFTPAQSLLSRTPAVSRCSHRTPRLFFSIWLTSECALELTHLSFCHRRALSTASLYTHCCVVFRLFSVCCYPDRYFSMGCHTCNLPAATLRTENAEGTARIQFIHTRTCCHCY